MLITIVICTYNRAEILKTTLPCYTSLIKPSAVKLELIIVDNNSNDETKTIAKGFTTKNKDDFANLVYVFEPKQGLSHARNTGYKHAKGDYIAYIDDECILPINWLEEAINTIKKQNKPAFLGGPYFGKFLPGHTSTWYKESFGDSYILQYKLPDGPMREHYLSGGNLIIRKDVFDKIGLFDAALGMSGETINYGEEQDFQKRLRLQYPNEVTWYNSKLFVWHCIRVEKISIYYLYKEALIRGQSSAKTKSYSGLELVISPILLLFFLLRAIGSFTMKFVWSIFSKEHFFSLLHEDYKSRVWRDIGVSEQRVKLLISLIFKGRTKE